MRQYSWQYSSQYNYRFVFNVDFPKLMVNVSPRTTFNNLIWFSLKRKCCEFLWSIHLFEVLGTSLDNLITKLEDPSQLDAALSAVKLFNKDPDFYSGYAKNFIMKSVKKGSDNDPRVGYIKQASKLVSSLESVLEGGDALMNEKSTSAEAVARVKKAQALIAKFIEESGTKDERFDAFIASHK